MARRLLSFALYFLSLIISSVQAQQASIVPIELPPGANTAIGNRVNDDGVVVGDVLFGGEPQAFRWAGPGTLQPLAAGYSQGLGVASDGNVLCGILRSGSAERATRWTNGVPEDLGTLAGGAGFSRAHYITDDGACIVGVSSSNFGDRAFRLLGGTMLDLGSLPGGSFSSAEGATPDGSIVVGAAVSSSGVYHAFRWRQSTNVMEDLGTIGGASGESVAWGVTDDGTKIVGYSASSSGQRPFVYASGAMQPLPTLGGTGFGQAFSVSADGSVIAGSAEGEACFWIDGQPYSLWQSLYDRGVDLSGWSSLGRCRCSPGGTRFTGQGVYLGQTVGFLATLGAAPPRPPRIDSWVTEGSFHFVRVGETFRASFVGTDFQGDDLTVTASGLPSPGTLTPSSGTTGPTPLAAELVFSPQSMHFGQAYDVTIRFASANGVATRSFELYVLQNEAPVVAAMKAETIECIAGRHNVELSSVVSDREGRPLSVTWKVDGVIQKQANVLSGAQVWFDFDYDHGVHAVTLEASDGQLTKSVGTTVTVQDTLAPIVVVAPDVTLPTDPGLNVATYELLPPTVFDASGDPTTLEGNAPSQFPLGETIVTWTATDQAGNETTATQKVIVVDREKPTLVGASNVKFFLDPGKLYSTQRPPLPEVSDNIDADLVELTDDAPAQFPLGTTKVTFTATDEAGNAATWITNVSVANRKPHADAGADVVVTTKSERGIRVGLDAGASFDNDVQTLKFLWTARGVKFRGAKTARPSGVFPVGTTSVLLTLTDVVGASDTDRVRVTVKLKNAKPRPRGAQANEAFAAAAHQAASSSNPAASSGLLYANAAAAYGDAAGEFVRWEDGQSEVDALLAYAELRMLQQTYGEAATRELLSAYAETGDESLLAAAVSAASGSAWAKVDLAE